jgi:hypothetical protein
LAFESALKLTHGWAFVTIVIPLQNSVSSVIILSRVLPKIQKGSCLKSQHSKEGCYVGRKLASLRILKLLSKDLPMKDLKKFRLPPTHQDQFLLHHLG